jgi:hypothetical protein
MNNTVRITLCHRLLRGGPVAAGAARRERRS